MGKCNGHTVCMSVAYKLDYCVKKALQFENASCKSVEFESVNKIKVGCLEKETKFTRSELKEYEKMFNN